MSCGIAHYIVLLGKKNNSYVHLFVLFFLMYYATSICEHLFYNLYTKTKNCFREQMHVWVLVIQPRGFMSVIMFYHIWLCP